MLDLWIFRLIVVSVLVTFAPLRPAETATVRVATVNFAPKLADVAGNRAEIIRLTEVAARAGAKIIVHTEMATSGYSYFSRQEISGVAETVPGPTTKAVGVVAKQYGAYVAVGMPEFESATDSYYNSAVVIGPDGNVAGVYRKRNNLLEAAYNAEDSGPVPVFDTPYGRLGVVICADLFYSEFPRLAAVAGANILLAPANVGITTDFLKVRAFENDFAIIVANRYGKGLKGSKQKYFNQDSFAIPSPFPYDFSSGTRSVIMEADGTVLADIDEDKDTIGYGDLTIATRRTLPVVRKPHMYALMAQDTLESYTFSQFGLPPAGVFAVAAVDPGPSATPWAAAAAAADRAVQTASGQSQSLKLIVYPAGYFPTADPPGLARLQSVAATNGIDLLISLAGTPPQSLLLASEGSTYSYIRTHRRPASAIPTSVLSDDYWVVDRPYARVALMQGVDMLPPETTNVASKMGVDVIAVSASSANPVLSALWKSRTGSNVHIVVANAQADEGVYLGGYRAVPSFMEAPGMVVMQMNTANVRAKKFPRFFDPQPLLQRCGQNNC